MRVFASIIVGLAAVFSPAALSQVAAWGSEDIPEEQKTVQIVLYPAAEPRPAMKYQLLPPFLERRPGNAAVWWNRIPIEQGWFFKEFNNEYTVTGKIWLWTEIPLGDPREKEYREKELAKVIHLLRDGIVYSDMDRAARFESCDWQQPIREGNYIAMLIPEVQHSRTYARMLSAKARLEIVEGKYVEAVRTLQTGYAEARHIAQSQTIVSSLVAVSIAGMMSNQVQQFIQQPNAPNLYWALSTLPRPLIDFRPGGESEANMLYLQFPELRDLDKKTLSPEEWRELLKKIVKDLMQFEGTAFRDMSPAMTAMLSLQGYSRAKRFLIEQGRTETEVEAMPVSQVILLYTVHVYDELSDDQFKWFFLPSAEAGDGPAQAENQMTRGYVAKREIIPVASMLLPACRAAKQAEMRHEWTLAMLRIFEAMRLYAAGHDGRWPDSLSDITEVPVPTNPIDGKFFVYQRQGNKAILSSEKGPRNVPWRHEITFMPKTK